VIGRLSTNGHGVEGSEFLSVLHAAFALIRELAFAIDLSCRSGPCRWRVSGDGL
jgi:hypothetical protein